MHGRVPDTAALGRVLAPEEGFVAIKPWKQSLLAVERWELETGARMEAGVGVVIFFLTEVVSRRRFQAKQWFRGQWGLGSIFRRPVDGVDRGIDIVLGVSLAIALG